VLLPTLVHARNGTMRGGTFVEIGAHDGTSLSNTLMLERCLGWRGVLIEGNPANFALLKSSGRASTMVQAAVCSADTDPPVVEFTVTGGPVAGHVGQLTRMHQHRWSFWNRAKGTRNVSCAPMSTLLNRSGFGEVDIDFLSLDVEGAEALVLSTVSPSIFKMVLVEMDGSDPAKDERARGILRAAGMRRIPSLTLTADQGVSEVYLRAGLEAREPARDACTKRASSMGCHGSVTSTQLRQAIRD